jgi:monoterpene epsilon-lactone hydrolase
LGRTGDEEREALTMASDELEAVIDVLRSMPMFTGDLAADRAAIAVGTPMPEGVDHRMVDLGTCTAAWITPPEPRRDAAIVYLHGGGYVLGGLGTHGAFADRLAHDSRLPALVVDYRLAPEHPHPAALDDALAAVDWLTAEQGVAPDAVVVAGDSAGGGLTLATLVALRDRGTPAAAGVAISPWADLACEADSHRTRAAADPLVATAALRHYAPQYAGDTPLDHPLVSPARADLAGLPPVLVQVGGLEVLLDDSRTVAARIEASGGTVVLQEWDEAPHVFQMLGAPESDEAIAEIVAFLATHVG